MISIAKPNIDENEKKAVMEVLESGNLAQGLKVAELEKRFSKLCSTKHAIATSNGTTALHTALYSLGVKPGDEVITTPFTFVSTANCILMCQAKPVFTDIMEDTFNIDPAKIQITKNTKAIIPVDLFGQPYDYNSIKETAKNNILILEDAAQAVGAMLDNKPAGSLGNASCFSLYATKNIISGEGGIITTNDDFVKNKARLFRNHGQGQKYEYLELGYNYRMTDIQAAIGIEQLKKLDSFTEKRIRNATLLSSGLGGIDGLIIPYIKKNCKHVFHQYTIRITDEFRLSRSELIEKLKQNGISSSIFYPIPLHLHLPFRKMGYKKGDFPVAEKISEEVLSLPVHPSVTDEDIKKIVEVIQNV
ncbi:MAG: DegT/DnrJ/EryC1/StrS family aminotransferase [Candidatus Omnitrophota bacterium]